MCFSSLSPFGNVFVCVQGEGDFSLKKTCIQSCPLSTNLDDSHSLTTFCASLFKLVGSGSDRVWCIRPVLLLRQGPLSAICRFRHPGMLRLMGDSYLHICGHSYTQIKQNQFTHSAGMAKYPLYTPCRYTEHIGSKHGDTCSHRRKVCS